MTETNRIKTPGQCSVRTLEKLRRRYAEPRNSREAFILHGIDAELERRDTEHWKLRGRMTREELKVREWRDEAEEMERKVKWLEEEIEERKIELAETENRELDEFEEMVGG